jgi:hypothetical protein
MFANSLKSLTFVLKSGGGFHCCLWRLPRHRKSAGLCPTAATFFFTFSPDFHPFEKTGGEAFTTVDSEKQSSAW